MPPIDKAVREVAGVDWRAPPDELFLGGEPVILRGLGADWPLVRAGRASAGQAIDHLRRFARDADVVAMIAPPQVGGRLFFFAVYDELDFAGVNFLLGDLARLAGMRFHQRRSAAGELAGAAGGHQNITIVAVKSVFQLHKPITFAFSGGTTRRRRPEYP